jgi:hypothetical protein
MGAMALAAAGLLQVNDGNEGWGANRPLSGAPAGDRFALALISLALDQVDAAELLPWRPLARTLASQGSYVAMAVPAFPRRRRQPTVTTIVSLTDPGTIHASTSSEKQSPAESRKSPESGSLRHGCLNPWHIVHSGELPNSRATALPRTCQRALE